MNEPLAYKALRKALLDLHPDIDFVGIASDGADAYLDTQDCIPFYHAYEDECWNVLAILAGDKPILSYVAKLKAAELVVTSSDLKVLIVWHVVNEISWSYADEFAMVEEQELYTEEVVHTTTTDLF